MFLLTIFQPYDTQFETQQTISQIIANKCISATPCVWSTDNVTVTKPSTSVTPIPNHVQLLSDFIKNRNIGKPSTASVEEIIKPPTQTQTNDFSFKLAGREHSRIVFVLQCIIIQQYNFIFR